MVSQAGPFNSALLPTRSAFRRLIKSLLLLRRSPEFAPGLLPLRVGHILMSAQAARQAAQPALIGFERAVGGTGIEAPFESCPFPRSSTQSPS